MPGREHRAAVLIGQFGDGQGVDLPGHVDDLALVKADQRPEHRHVHHRVRGPQGRHGLAGHLADTLARDQRFALGIPRNTLRDPHHIAPHDQRGVFLRALLVDGHLDLGKRHNVHLDAAAAEGQLPRQVQHLFLRPVRGIGIAVEVHRVDLHAALGDHPASDRAVDSAGKQQRRVAVGANGHTADRRDHLHIQIGHIPDLDVHQVLRIMHVHLQVWIGLQDTVAHFLVDGHGVHGIPLVRPAGIDLEGAFQVLRHLHRLGTNGLKVLLGHLHRGTHAVHTENLRHPADALLQVTESPDKDPAVMNPHFRAHAAHGITHLSHQRTDKVRTVQSLQEDFAVADKK